jgi:hypothetical protein
LRRKLKSSRVKVGIEKPCVNINPADARAKNFWRFPGGASYSPEPAAIS